MGPSAKTQRQQSPPLHPPRPPLVNRGGSDGSRGSRGNKQSNNTSATSKDVFRPPPPSQQQQQKKHQPSSQRNISVDTIVSSQFENEAETHILAALEIEERDQSNLLGEGIDVTGGMDDYSEDDDDDEDDASHLYPEAASSEEIGHRARTYSTDSFLKR
eukprot:CAMPEP_0201691932 /NCGR_PEP_ID=MMETSP0578-20130828/4958_1 /ASSEMBLY_ACC=CAM_ASM_000663 /TAXON_ID=267565 /ORGANISM="Skeletonema grethea, Strain CCMP 1804" /LENGTH=158 /DNA_ID=CAMNT_0048177221 /DNA_START=147 /DNA_END=619 /DNA_ORIENTATION=+